MKVDCPGKFGIASEDCNCRCCVLQRARWAVKNETTYQKWNNETGGFIETTGYQDFKEKYLKEAQKISPKIPALKNSQKGGKINFTAIETTTSKALQSKGIDYNEVLLNSNILTNKEIIHTISGGDLTKGSCASVALAYAGQKQGWNVLDFRDGESRRWFSSKLNKINMFKDLGVKSIVEDSAKSNLTNGKRILEQLQEGSEYYLSVGTHAAIVRKNKGILQYLELQHPKSDRNGWNDFGDVTTTLKHRFGCTSSSAYYSTAYATDISQLNGDDFRTILGYINTDTAKQRKGATGNVR
mgnify:FL=1